MTGRFTGPAGEAAPGDPGDRVDGLLAGLEARWRAAAPGAAGRDGWCAATATSASEPVIVIEPGC